MKNIVNDMLPLGSIVTLKNGDNKIMIVGRFQRHEASNKVFDYSSVAWPGGMFDSIRGVYMFDHKEIGEVYSKGFEDLEELCFRFSLEDQYESKRH